MALVRSVTLDTANMPTSRAPAVILTGTGTRKGQAKGRRSRARGSRILGRRGGFPHPAPSQVPTGSLETKSKVYDIYAPGGLTANGYIHHINNISGGNGNAERIGYKVRNTALHIKGQFSAPQTNGPRAAVTGYVLVWDKSPNLALPAVSSIFKIDAGAGYDMSNTFPVDNDRFVILKSKRRTICNSTDNGVNTVLVDDYIKLPHSCVTGYVKGNASGVIANLQTGGLFLVPYRAVTEAGSTADNEVILRATMELFFAEA